MSSKRFLVFSCVRSSLLWSAMLSACGSATHLDPDGGTRPDAGVLAAGEVCSESAACASHFCLSLTPNSQNVSGLCSSACRQSADCGDRSVCLPERSADGGPGALDGGACYRTCSAPSDCVDGVPCIWQPWVDAGSCQPLRATFCGDIGSAGPCDTCLGAHCCGEVKTCAEDVECSKLESTSWRSSGNVVAKAVASCAASACATRCAP